jgi:hypothetical protein
LRQPLGDVRLDAADVLADELNLFASKAALASIKRFIVFPPWIGLFDLLALECTRSRLKKSTAKLLGPRRFRSWPDFGIRWAFCPI